MRKNHKKKNPNYSEIAGLFLVGVSVFLALGLITFAQGTIGTGPGTNTQASQQIIGVICQIFNTIKSIIFILGLTLMILGGALFAGANLMPSEQRGGFKNYGMAMIIGGVVGVAIAVAAPFILNLIIRTNPNATTVITTPGPNGQQGAIPILCNTGLFGVGGP